MGDERAVFVVVPTGRQELVDDLLVERYRPGRLSTPGRSPLWMESPGLPDLPEVAAERRRRLCEALDGRHLAAVPEPPPRSTAA